MANLMQETVDWSLYPFRLIAKTMDLVTRTTADVGTAMTGAVRTESEAPTHGFRSWRTENGDFGDDDNKVVQSYIVCTKPDHEQVYEVHTEVVNYSTTSEAYAGVVMGRFLRQHPEFKDEDLRYLKPHVKVVDRYPKEEEDEDNDKHHHRRHEAEYTETRSEPVLT